MNWSSQAEEVENKRKARTLGKREEKATASHVWRFIIMRMKKKWDMILNHAIGK